MKKLFSLLGRRYDAPSSLEIQAIIRRFTRIEQTIFFALIILLFISVGGILLGVNAALSEEQPAHRGTWREGAVGLPHLINPLLAVSDTDRDLTSLVYAGLLRADGKGRLTNDLAEQYRISEDGYTYTFILKDNLVWHDGEPLTAEDIAFTIMLAKNPSLKSPIRANWEGVDPIVINEREIQFQLERPYAPFLENATLGILPKHIWSEIPPEQLNLSKFNVQPIGAGPYAIGDIARNSSGIVTRYALRAFKDYAQGEPFITSFEFKFYPSERMLVSAFEKKEVDGIAGLSPQRLTTLEKSPYTLRTLTLPRVFGVFLNQNKRDIFTKQQIRKALQRAVNKERIIDEVFLGFAEPLFSPIPPGTFSALDANDVPHITSTSSTEGALTLFAQAGWTRDKPDESGEEEERPAEEHLPLTNKDGETLRFTLSTSNVPDLVRTAELLKDTWEALGMEIELKIFELSDLNQNVIRPREYEALLFGEIVGRDPDPFAFWHSSQRNDPGLNIALYANTTIDPLLEEARTLSDENKRKEKYQQFQEEVINDNAAIFLYSPLYLYITATQLNGFDTENITVPAERFTNVHQWFLHTKKVFKFF